MTADRNPAAFGTRGTLAIVIAGFVTFVLLLVWIGTGLPPGEDGGAHGLGKGITGYAALAAMLDAGGDTVTFNRAFGPKSGHGLLILTPQVESDAGDIGNKVLLRRQGLGPTIVIHPKWIAMPLRNDPRPPQTARGKWWAGLFGAPRAPAGWSTIVGTDAPRWPGWLDHVQVAIGTEKSPPAHGWRSGDGTAGALPNDRVVEPGLGTDDDNHPLIPLVRSGDGRVLAGYYADGGAYPALDALAGVGPTGTDASRRPLIMVFEPDLLNNQGLATRANGLLAQRLIAASLGNMPAQPVVFDLALAGLGAPRNLLTLAFTPPFLAATICLLLAMAGSVWRGFTRFGPALATAPGAAPGKTALITGAATLLLRAGRMRIMGTPYADAVRDRLRRALSLPRARDDAATDAAIARVQATIAPDTVPFGEAAARLIAARTPAAITARAAELQTIEHLLGHARLKETL